MIDKALFTSASSLAEYFDCEKKMADRESDDEESLFLRRRIPKMRKFPDAVMSNIRFQIEVVIYEAEDQLTGFVPQAWPYFTQLIDSIPQRKFKIFGSTNANQTAAGYSNDIDRIDAQEGSSEIGYTQLN